MKISDHIISQEATLLEALNRLNATRSFTLFAVDADERVVGSITDGDIRRALIAGVKLDDKIEGVCHRSFRFIDAANQATPKLRKEIRQSGIHLIPYIDENGRIARLIDLTKIKGLLPIDGVLMAGGRGERLQPLTDNCPKPLLPLGGKPIVEHNVDRMLSYGIDNITFSVRYLGEQIKAYFGNGEKWNAYVRELYTELADRYATRLFGFYTDGIGPQDGFRQRLDQQRVGDVVAVYEQDQVTGGHVQTLVPGSGNTFVGSGQCSDLGMLRCQFPDQVRGAVGGTIIDQDDLEVLVTLCKERSYTLLQYSFSLVDWDDDRDESVHPEHFLSYR